VSGRVRVKGRGRRRRRSGGGRRRWRRWYTRSIAAWC